ncbi:MAG: EamA family transporter [Marmoricola sp.]
MTVLIALGAAMTYGLSDVVGGAASRRTSAWPVATVSAATALVAALAIALLLPGTPSTTDLLWGALAGIGNGAGAGFLYRGLASGRMGVVGPVSGVGAAAIPVIVGVLTGERPAALVWAGILVAAPAIWLVAREPRPDVSSEEVHRPGLAAGLLDGVLAGCGFGLVFSALGQVEQASGYWPVALSQAVGVPTVILLALAVGGSAVPRHRSELHGGMVSGVLSATALVGFLVATQQGLLAVSAVLTSLYPAGTVLLAAVVLHERVHRIQAVGLTLCAVCVTLVALG